MRLSAVIVLALTLVIPVSVGANTDLIESVSRQYANNHPGLESYRAKLKTNKTDEMLKRMTANMPKDVPRPQIPELIKHWNRQTGTVIRPATPAPLPYMQQMINRFSRQFAVDLGALFLPMAKAVERKELLKSAVTKRTDAEIAGKKMTHIEIKFSEPTDIGDAFYGSSIDLPQKGINTLSFDIDTEKKILTHMDIEAEEKLNLAIEIRHLDIVDNNLPSVVHITSPDGGIDEKLVTTFQEIKGYHLPVKQERKIRRPGKEDMLLVEFFDYELVVK